jgi:aspartate-semialdehyde dehydrogenase
VRDALCRARVPGERVTLYASTAGEAVLSEYGDEARLIQAIDLEELRRSDVLFLCDLGTDAARIETLGSIDGTIVDLTGALAGDPRSRLVRPTDQGDLDAAPGSVLVVPHEITILLLEVLAPLARAREIEDATAFVLRPASDFGDAGVDELREQTVRLLNFGRVPREVFARQLAFNVVPQSELEDASYATERRVIDETRRELAWDRDRLALRMAVVPVFLGHAAQLRVRRDGGVDEARSILRDSGVRLSEPGRSAPRTPLEASAEGPRTVVEVSDDGCGGVWVWLVSGELSARRAGLAVRAALDASGL